MAALSDEQVEFFNLNGYLIVEDVVDHDSVLNPLKAEYEELLNRLVDGWVREGRLAADVSAQPFDEQLVSAHVAGCDFFQHMDISLPLDGIKADTPLHTGPAAFNLLACDDLIDVAEALVGPEVTSVPIQHVRVKPRQALMGDGDVRPHLIATQWHQDRAVARAEADETNIVTTWVAVTKADEDNGCLMVIPGSHRGEMLDHCPTTQLGIPDKLLDQSKATPMPVGPGGVVLFHPMTIHGSLPNRSDRLRWSFDLRYCKTGEDTGRHQFPEFIARSRSAPETELRDAEAWARSWFDTRDRLAAADEEEIGYFHRWSNDAPICA